MYTEIVPEETEQEGVFRNHAIEIIVGMALLKVKTYPEIKEIWLPTLVNILVDEYIKETNSVHHNQLLWFKWDPGFCIDFIKMMYSELAHRILNKKMTLDFSHFHPATLNSMIDKLNECNNT